MSRLDEIKARCAAATEGPWVRDMHSPDMSGRSGWYIRGPRKLGLRSMVLNSRMLSGDAEFVEAAREDVPWLVAEVERLTRVIDAKPRQPLVVLNEYLDRAEKAETEVRRLTALVQSTENKADGYLAEIESAHAERDALVARVAEAVHLTDVWVSDLATDAMVNAMDPEALEAINEQMKRLLELRAALTDSEDDASDTQPIDQEKQ